MGVCRFNGGIGGFVNVGDGVLIWLLVKESSAGLRGVACADWIKGIEPANPNNLQADRRVMDWLLFLFVCSMQMTP